MRNQAPHDFAGAYKTMRCPNMIYQNLAEKLEQEMYSKDNKQQPAINIYNTMQHQPINNTIMLSGADVMKASTLLSSGSKPSSAGAHSKVIGSHRFINSKPINPKNCGAY